MTWESAAVDVGVTGPVVTLGLYLISDRDERAMVLLAPEGMGHEGTRVEVASSRPDGAEPRLKRLNILA